MKKLGKLIFIRHGESVWNVTDATRGFTTRFTGWADIPLSDSGILQAQACGRCLKKLNLDFHAAFTSLLSRARVTFANVAEVHGGCLQNIPVIASWRLNERHYGALVGLSKEEAEIMMGKEKVMGWRRSWDLRPPPMVQHPFFHSVGVGNHTHKNPMFDWQSEIWTKAMTISTENNLEGQSVATVHVDDSATIPLSESLADTADRVLPLWKQDIFPRILKGETILVVAHSNTIRSMVKHIDNISKERIREVTIPSATPLLYTFAQDLLTGDILNMGKPSSLGMRGRFIVTKELLELSLKANQHLEMSENLDTDDSFKVMLSETLVRMKSGRSLSHSMTDAGLPAETGVMESGWMTFPDEK